MSCYLLQFYPYHENKLHKNTQTTKTDKETTNISHEAQRGPGQLDILSGERDLSTTAGSLYTFSLLFGYTSLLKTVLTASFSAKPKDTKHELAVCPNKNQ